MDLIDRYLAAVRWNLPGDKADDIMAELQDVLASRIEDREEALGRPLTRDETSALLREFGHPLTVAGRYHGQRVLIGPEVFPFWWFALQVVLAITLVVEAIQVAGRMIINSPHFMQAISQGTHDLIQAGLVNAALVTLAFAVIERTGWLATYLERWKPEELPDLSSLQDLSSLKGLSSLRGPRVGAWQRRQRVRPGRTIWEPAASLAFGAAFMLWWFGVLVVPVFPNEAEVAVHPTPIWATLFWPVAALVATRMAYALVTLLRRRWKPLRGALIVGCTLGTLAIAALLYQGGQIVTVSGADAGQVADIQRSLDLAFHYALIIIPLITVWQMFMELWQLYREP